MSYIRDTAKGVAWIGAFRIITRVVSLGKTILLARILTPSQFGVFGVVALTLSLIEVATETGINTVLIQKRDSISEYINSAWSVSIIRGFFIGLLMVCFSLPVSTFFHIPQAMSLIIFAAIIPAVRGFINPLEVMFQKDLLFKKEFIFRTVIFSVDALVSIVLAVVTRNPSSLIWGILAGALFEMLLSHIIISPRPKLELQLEKAKFILKRGRWITFTGVLDYLIQNGDNIAVGRVLGSSPLGFYQMAYQISTLPVTEISNILSKVMLPVFVKMSGNKKHMLTAYFKLLFALTLLVGVATGFLIYFALPIVLLVLGSNWTPIVLTIQILAAFAFVKSLVLSSYAFFLAIEKQEVVSVISLTGFLGMFASILPLMNLYGINGAAYAALFGAIISTVPVVFFIIKERNRL